MDNDLRAERDELAARVHDLQRELEEVKQERNRLQVTLRREFMAKLDEEVTAVRAAAEREGLMDLTRIPVGRCGEGDYAQDEPCGEVVYFDLLNSTVRCGCCVEGPEPVGMDDAALVTILRRLVRDRALTVADPDLIHLAPGTPVVVRLDDGKDWETTTRSSPWQLGHGEWVVLLTGKVGGYQLSRIRLRYAQSA
jgi:hypothetical protein